MSRYIGKRVSYECGFCKKQFTLNKQSVDDGEKSGEVFCSNQCGEQFYLSDVIKSVCPLCKGSGQIPRLWTEKTICYKCGGSVKIDYNGWVYET